MDKDQIDIVTMKADPPINEPEQGPQTSCGETADVLLVDDNPINLQMFRDYLEARGLRVAISETGDDAIARAEVGTYGVIVMDVQMPGTDGVEAIRRIRTSSKSASVPMIAVTALTAPADRQRCLAAGANEYLSKPVRLRDLGAAIDRFRAPSARS